MNSKRGISRKRAQKAYKKRILLTTLMALFLGTAAVGTSLAFLVDSTTSITNKFTPSKVTGEIEENFDNKVKENVQIKNTGDVAAYVRVMLVPNWVDKEENIAAEVNPNDYEIGLGLEDSGWFKGSDGYYYYSYPVAAQASTGVLIDSCKPLVSKTDASGNELHFALDVIASLIQAEPDAAVEKAWKVKVTGDEGNKTISKSTRSNE